MIHLYLYDIGVSELVMPALLLRIKYDPNKTEQQHKSRKIFPGKAPHSLRGCQPAVLFIYYLHPKEVLAQCALPRGCFTCHKINHHKYFSHYGLGIKETEETIDTDTSGISQYGGNEHPDQDPVDDKSKEPFCETYIIMII